MNYGPNVHGAVATAACLATTKIWERKAFTSHAVIKQRK